MLCLPIVHHVILPQKNEEKWAFEQQHVISNNVAYDSDEPVQPLSLA